MSRLSVIRSAIVAVAILSLAGWMSPARAAPLVPATALMTSADLAVVTPVRWRGHGGGGAALAAGLATGLIIGGLVAAPHYHEPYPYYDDGYYVPRYVGPVGYGAPGSEGYCFSRYRSFDPISGTYLGYDGRRHYCR
jgi:hypothetical protein